MLPIVRRSALTQSVVVRLGLFAAVLALVFGAAAAVGAGLAVAVDQVQQDSILTDTQAGLTVTVSAVVYLVVLWALHYPYKRPGVARDIAPPIAIVLILASSFTPEPVLLTGVVLASLVVISVVSYSQPATR